MSFDIQSIDNYPFYTTKPLIIAGPCSVESEEQIEQLIHSFKNFAVSIFRAGIWKPRTRPDSFQGVGEQGLKWLNQVKNSLNIPVAVEVASAMHVKLCLQNNIDILWLGARTTVNPFLVQEICNELKGTDTIIMIKNPINPDIDLWTGAIERMYNTGIKKIIAIHRGFSSFEKTIFRNNPLWEIPIELKRRFKTLPLICDPSHICGNKESLSYISQKAMDLNFDGLMIETHPAPNLALSDREQQITPEELKNLINQLILRKSYTENPVIKANLEELRNKIDLIDYQIIDLLMKRMQEVEKIGTFKKENNITIYQQQRWDEILQTRIKYLQQDSLSSISEKWLKKLLELLHQESMRVQNTIMNKKIY